MKHNQKTADLAREIFVMRLSGLPPMGSLEEHQRQIDHQAEFAVYAARSLAITLEHRDEEQADVE